MKTRTILLAFVIVIQFMLEITLGRVFVAPSLIPFLLVYFSENFEKVWAIDGAFWSGICLDLLLHQPVGSSSLGLLAGLYLSGKFSRISSGEGRGYLISMTAIATVVSDTVFILVASRPFGSGFGPLLLKVFPRAALSVVAAALILMVVAWAGDIRARRVAG